MSPPLKKKEQQRKHDGVTASPIPCTSKVLQAGG